MKEIIVKIFNKILSMIFHRNINKIRWFKSIYFNFKILPFNQAKKLPILIYENITINSLSGNAFIKSKVQKGMIKIGYNLDKFSASKGGALYSISGTIIFNGEMIISTNCVIEVLNGKTLEFGKNTSLGDGIKVKCWDQIKIGDFTRIGFESQIFDTNFHYIRNIETGEILRKSSPINIGDYCFIGNRTNIMKGSCVPNFSIVGSNSLLNKDYCSFIAPGSIIAGLPAKLVATGYERVHSNKLEKEIDEYFDCNTENNYIGFIGFTNKK